MIRITIADVALIHQYRIITLNYLLHNLHYVIHYNNIIIIVIIYHNNNTYNTLHYYITYYTIYITASALPTVEAQSIPNYTYI